MNTEARHESASPVDHTHEVPAEPFGESLVGEYVRMLMIGTAACSAIFWAAQAGMEQSAPMMIVACIAALGALTSDRFAGLVRLALLLSVMIGLIATMGTSGDWMGPIPFFCPAVLLCGLGMLASRDMVIALRGRIHGFSLRTIGIAVAVAAPLIYLIVVPAFSSFLDQFKEQPASFVVEELTAFEVLRIRSSKLLIFLIFLYFGGCVGSFFNVVAASVPRGESIAFRPSKCPKCETPIRRLDNLPIVSYLMLQGRCRDCNVPIPVRYLAVELIAATIFASLFLYELVTGAANVPGFQHYHYTGIVWIILYTKWPVVGIYFYHALVFSCLLMFALMEADGLRCPRLMAVVIVGVFAALAVVAPVLQPVALDDQLPIRVSETIPPWTTRAMTCFVGGLAGGLIAVVASRARPGVVPTVSLILLGVTLGWQATITIALIWTVASVAIGRLSRGFQPTWLGPTAMLLAASLLHHPAWKWLTRFW